jgi:hypothetical protein
MGYLDQVLNLKKEGKSDEEIKKILSETGASPKDIDEAIKQAEIKSAISEFGTDEELQPSMMDGEEPEEPNIPIPNQEEKKPNKKEEIEEPKIVNPFEISQQEFNIPLNNSQQFLNMNNDIDPNFYNYPKQSQEENYENFYNPKKMTQEENFYESYSSQDYPNEQYPPQQEYYEQYPSYNQEYPNYPQEYSAYNQYSPNENSQNIDMDNIIEMVNQIFLEKIKKFQEERESLLEDLNSLKSRVGFIDERLKRIENFIEKLQLSILERIGDYGQDLNNIKKEIGLMQDSFSKFVSKI